MYDDTATARRASVDYRHGHCHTSPTAGAARRSPPPAQTYTASIIAIVISRHFARNARPRPAALVAAPRRPPDEDAAMPWAPPHQPHTDIRMSRACAMRASSRHRHQRVVRHAIYVCPLSFICATVRNEFSCYVLSARKRATCCCAFLSAYQRRKNARRVDAMMRAMAADAAKVRCLAPSTATMIRRCRRRFTTATTAVDFTTKI